MTFRADAGHAVSRRRRGVPRTTGPIFPLCAGSKRAVFEFEHAPSLEAGKRRSTPSLANTRFLRTVDLPAFGVCSSAPQAARRLRFSILPLDEIHEQVETESERRAASGFSISGHSGGRK
jgi:hypothetical protein